MNTRHAFFLELLGLSGAWLHISDGLLLAGAARHQMVDLLVALECEIKPAQHQDRRDRGGRKLRQQKCRRQQDQKLVLQGAQRYAPDDGQLTPGGETRDIARRDGGVVDDDACSLGTGFASLRRCIVDGGGRDLGERRAPQRRREVRATRSCA